MLQDANKLDIYSLSRKWKELVDKARAKQLQPQGYNCDYLLVFGHRKGVALGEARAWVSCHGG